VRERIAGYTDAVLEAADPPRRALIADNLASVAQLLVGNDDLAQALSDPGVPAPSRRAILTDLLEGRIDDYSLRLVAYCADSDRATEFVEDVHWLTTRAEAARDGLRTLDVGPLGRRAASERMDGYATAVLEEVDGERALGEIEDELFRFTRIVGGSEELQAVLLSGDLPSRVRRSVVGELLDAKTTPATSRLAAYATDVGRARDYLVMLEEVLVRVAAEGDHRVADVRAFLPLDDVERHRLASALHRLTGRNVEIRITVDRTVLGGFVATVGDTVVDGSARHRLELLKDRLLLPEVAPIDNSDNNPGESA
jgi:F-type H+-transporting ATPase subunit delta